MAQTNSDRNHMKSVISECYQLHRVHANACAIYPGVAWFNAGAGDTSGKNQV
jgi:hypothetical protein